MQAPRSFVGLRTDVRHVLRLQRELRKQGAAARRTEKALRHDIREVRRELHERLLQYHLQLGRLSRHVGSEVDAPVRLSGTSRPAHLEDSEQLGWESVGGAEGSPDPDGKEWLTLTACPMCGCGERTVVSEWNKLLLLQKAPDASAVRYDYAVCHSCGVLSASRRPYGERFRFLLKHFGEVTAKVGGSREIRNPLLNPYPLSDAQKDDLRRLASAGVFVSDHLGRKSSEYVGGLMRDRFENSIHLDVIASHLSPKGARVLEVRSRAGTILDGLRRLFDAEVYAMPIWESQQFLLREVYNITVSSLIDFDRFQIPYEGLFDLIICNHMVTHVVRPQEFFDALRRHLRPGGHLYLHNEPDDAEFLRGGQSMIATLNPLHLQAFDQRSLIRALAANGFSVVFIKARGDLKHMCLARYDGEVQWDPMPETERSKRITDYQMARDRSILRIDPALRSRVVSVWDQAVERGMATGVAEFDATGQLRLVAREKPPS